MEHTISRRVLVLADEHMLARRITDLLERAGYEVAGPAANIRRAKQVVGIEGVNRAILDADIDGENSVSLAAEIVCQGAPVLLVTDHVKRNACDGRERFPQLEKPFRDEELLRRVGAIFGS